MSLADEISLLGIQLPQKLLSDLNHASAILQNRETVDRQLLKLEKLIQEDLTIKGINYTEFLMMLPNEKKRNSYKCYKLLSDTLYKWGKENGFAQDWGKVASFLSRDTFLSLLNNRFLIKDIGAGADHGEFTHAIQLFILTEANKEQEVISRTIPELYARISNQDCVGILSIIDKDTQKETNKILTIWDLLFDRFEKISTFDLRNPELTCGYLRFNSVQFPLLSQLHRLRYFKRINESTLFSNSQNNNEVQDIIFQKPSQTRTVLSYSPSMGA